MTQFITIIRWVVRTCGAAQQLGSSLPCSRQGLSSPVLEHLACFGGEEDDGISRGFPLLQAL